MILIPFHVLSMLPQRKKLALVTKAILAEHFAAEWKEKHKIDAKSNKKAMYRLLTAAEKTKKVLSANPTAPINIECFMDVIDVKGMMERSEMLTVAEPMLARLD